MDVETQMPGDLFTQMRAVFTLQRMQALARQRANDKAAPALLTVRDVIEFATIDGARANHLDRKIGTLTPGKEADIILLRTRRDQRRADEQRLLGAWCWRWTPATSIR